MLQISQLSYAVGGRELIKNVNWPLRPGRRYALYGPNGTGKTTLLKLISSQIKPDSGQIICPSGFRIGYLPQEEESAQFRGSVLELVLKGHYDLYELGIKIQNVHKTLDGQKDSDANQLKKLGILEEMYRIKGGYDLEYEARAILSGLGFKPADFQESIAKFSGGWRMRVYLARILILKPDLLLLDEPTNHLDLSSLEWLEQYLLDYKGTLILVSHDRYFVDRLAQEIAELENGRISFYTGNYRSYTEQKSASYNRLYEQWKAQQEEIARIEKWIERFRYKATKAPQVQSRLKMLEKMERIELPAKPVTFDFSITVLIQSYKEVVYADEMSFSYGPNKVIDKISFCIYRGERIALVGANGAGKTTLTRLINGGLEPGSGLIKLGNNVEAGYYAQHQIDALNLDASVLAEASASSLFPELQVRKILGVFGFTGNDVFKQIRVLSGGEKARVSLAKILARPANFLIMDEPTNHLDIVSREALEKALSNYSGTLLLISHDRYFLDSLVSRVWELNEGKLNVVEGNYSDYLQKRNENEVYEKTDTAKSIYEDKNRRKTKEQKRMEAEKRQAISKTRRNLNDKIMRIEHDIARAEEEKEALENTMSSPSLYDNPAESAGVQKKYKKTLQVLNNLYENWEVVQMSMESMLENLEEED